jgi:hypothetical protein
MTLLRQKIGRGCLRSLCDPHNLTNIVVSMYADLQIAPHGEATPQPAIVNFYLQFNSLLILKPDLN